MSQAQLLTLKLLVLRCSRVSCLACSDLRRCTVHLPWYPSTSNKSPIGLLLHWLQVIFKPGPEHSVVCQNPGSRAITTITCLVDLNLMLQSPSEILENMDWWYCNSISNKLCPK